MDEQTDELTARCAAMFARGYEHHTPPRAEKNRLPVGWCVNVLRTILGRTTDDQTLCVYV